MAFPLNFTVSGPATVDNVLATTLANWVNSGKFYDAVFTGRPLTKIMLQKDKIEFLDGGESIRVNLMYAENGTVDAIDPYGTVDLTPQEVFTSAQASWRWLVGSVSVSDHDRLVNTTPMQIVNLAKSKVENLQESVKQKLARMLFASSTAANEYTSLLELVDSAGTVQGINRSTYSWFQSTETASGSFATQGLNDLRTNYNSISKSGTMPPTLGVTTQTIHEYIENTYLAQGRFDLLGGKGAADLGIDSLKFKGKDVFFDELCPSGTFLWLNLDVLGYVMSRAYNFKMGEFVRPANQIVESSILENAGNLVIKNPARCGKLTGITA